MKPRKELIQRRQELNLTHNKVSKRARIFRPYYTNIESGCKVPSMKLAEKIADILQATVDQIFLILMFRIGTQPDRTSNVLCALPVP